MSAEEQWRAIPGYEGYYEVSDQGRVRSFKSHWGDPGPRILSTRTNPGGYLTVNLGHGRDHRETARVHTVVARAFIGPKPFEGAHIRHLNGQKTDNRLANLTYGTPSENGLDRARLGEDHLSTRSACANGHPFDASNTYDRVDGGRRGCRVCRRRWAAEYRARQQAKANGVPADEIRKWAQAHGPSARSHATHFPDSVLDAFFAAHPERVAESRQVAS